jgi:diguanylate cyclase (GGDEF)-like protein
MVDAAERLSADRERRWEARLTRERRARAEAELLLEAKSLQLYEANVALAALADGLERRVAERTLELSEARRQAVQQAETDALTGIANRAAFMQRLEAALLAGEGIAVLLIDLDDFKSVNDTLGHAAGDALLVEVTRRLVAGCRPGDLVGRLGGDEFAVLAQGVGEAAAQLIAQRLLDSVGLPVTVDGRNVPSGCSIGLASAAPGTTGATKLLGDADLALYAAKRAGRGRVRTFEASLREDLERRTAFEGELRRAVLADQVQPWYQPVRRCRDRRFVGAEVLARWHHPDGSVRPPASFLGTVEACGLLDLMTESMLRVALREAAPLVAAGALEYLSINVSPTQFGDGWPLRRLPGLLQDAGYPAGALVVEITETALVQDMDRARASLEVLCGRGIRVAVDDFGVGFSNFSLLRQLRFHKLKIDRTLVCDIETDAHARAVAECILALAARLGIRAIAEGVETEGQAALLAAADCDSLQGYLFARPGRRLENFFGAEPRGD